MATGAGEPRPRRFNLGDLLILIGVIAITLTSLKPTEWWARISARTGFWSQAYAHLGASATIMGPDWKKMQRLATAQMLDEFVLQVLIAVLQGLTLAQLLLRLGSPRPPRGQLVRQAGFVSCLAATIGYILIFNLEWLGEFELPPWLIQDLTLLLLWPVLGLRPWRTEPCGIDRLGRAVGWGWIVASATRTAVMYLPV